MSDALTISLSTIKSTNYGDHAERLRSDHAVVPGETVDDLVRRLFPDLGALFRSHDATDVIEIRVLVGQDGQIADDVRAAPEASPF